MQLYQPGTKILSPLRGLCICNPIIVMKCLGRGVPGAAAQTAVVRPFLEGGFKGFVRSLDGWVERGQEGLISEPEMSVDSRVAFPGTVGEGHRVRLPRGRRDMQVSRELV